ncbi:MAG: hypothetical protein Q4D43_05385 [Clostridia bacterium]|nr:hypothetical protein [Clostridia bacterium]
MAGIELNTDTSRLDFLFKKISMPRNNMVTWLFVPEFVDAINSLVDKKIEVTDDNVLKICEEILSDSRFGNKEYRLQYHLKSLRKGYNRLRRATEEDSEPASESERTS